MASRKEQKEQARAARLAAEQDAASSAARTRRLQLIGGAVVIAVAIVVVLIAISAGNNSPSGAAKPHSKEALSAVKQADTLLAGLPESGNTVGKASAPVTVTEFGDLECSVCDMFATPPSFTNPEHEAGTGLEDQLIDQDVRDGTVKLAYRSMQTATPDASAFDLQQVAAEAAGLQGKEWYFVELFYNEQGAEGSDYVTSSFLDGIAKQIPGLNYAQWLAALSDSKLLSQVNADDAAAQADGATGTPTLVVQGPDGEKALPSGLPSSFSQIQTAINSVN
jgi:protein-disulfide isomerase